MSSATILVIGDELLHGEIRDQNGPWLIERFNQLGVDVERLHLLPDQTDLLVEYIRQALSCEYVITTGGIGPTHDDRTREAVAKALDRNLVPHDHLLSLLRERHGDNLTQSQKKLAKLPENSEIIQVNKTAGIAFRAENVFVFPGIPELLQPLFNRLEEEFKGTKKTNRSLTIKALESDIADQLMTLQNQYPQLQFGSYPHDDGSLTLKIRGRDEDSVTKAFEDLRDSIEYPEIDQST